ncbi:hypothetical protein [uncultured Enterovirga sp.]|uniref:hypothetical protein n=1 Tax=uncultured Enterovirga sp. TaxID=2026352 RepID=UPI0035CAEF91
MKLFDVTLALALLSAGPAPAQTDMSCADYLKADAEMQAAISAADKAALAKDPSATALDRKVREYCTKNPKAPASEAMEKAVMN